MSVLPGEGNTTILFGGTRVAAGPRIHDAYLVRPDLAGQWPTVVLLPDAPGLSSSTKALARQLGRRGMAVVVVDVYEGEPPKAAAATEAYDVVAASSLDRLVDDVIDFVCNPAADWSSAEDGFGLLGIGSGGVTALLHSPRASAVAVVGGRLAPVPATVPVLGLYGRQDPATGAVDEMREALPQAEWVIYANASAGFHDDAEPMFDASAATDAVERIVEFFGRHLPASPAV